MKIPYPQIKTTDQLVDEGKEYLYVETPRNGARKDSAIVRVIEVSEDPKSFIKKHRIKIEVTEVIVSINTFFAIGTEFNVYIYGTASNPVPSLWELYDKQNTKPLQNEYTHT